MVNLNRALTATLVLLAAMLSSAADARQAQTWGLKEIRVFQVIDGAAAQIVAEQYDARGGTVDVTMNGNYNGACPGGAETLRFRWAFQGDVNQIRDGAEIRVTIAVERLSAAGACKAGGYARHSYLYLAGSAGVFNPFTQTESTRIDVDRTWFKSGISSVVGFAEGSATSSGAGTIGVSDRPGDPNKPLAYFQVYVVSPTASGGGFLRYVYLYERGASPTGPVPPPPPPPPPLPRPDEFNRSECFQRDPDAGSYTRAMHRAFAERTPLDNLFYNIGFKVGLIFGCAAMSDAALVEFFATMSEIIARAVPDARCFGGDQGVVIQGAAAHRGAFAGMANRRERLNRNLQWKAGQALGCIPAERRADFFAELSMVIAQAPPPR